ncbi:hypothetical protein Agub_g10302 [Astrephomene gubernaculifera]|uniref:Phosphodiesterase n=1 Tax=Astrephomene gubernaculifera TaxID=47775 RepID=A0AAD3HPK7_9CHLO|nr:hypothetical protein Agub_g10302 [Astrephomene gubernaculifera]
MDKTCRLMERLYKDVIVQLSVLITRLRAKGEGIYRIVRADASTYLWPLAVLALVLGVGVWGVARVGEVEEKGAKDRAASVALDTAIWYRQQLTVCASPVLLMAAMVGYDPQYSAVSSLFKVLAPALLSQTAPNITKQLEYVPFGVVQDVYPMTGNNGAAVGFDLFASSDADGAVKTIEDNTLTLAGPLAFFEGGYGVIVRQPIFIPGVQANETFGIPNPLNPYCGAPCEYNETTRTKFWGFAAALIDLDALAQAEDSKLRTLEAMGYRYEVLALGIAAADMRQVAARWGTWASMSGTCAAAQPSSVPPSDPVEAQIHLPNNEWVVRVSPASGWRSSAYRGLLSGVIVMAVALALLLFLALVSRRQHEMLLKALLPKQVIKDLGKDAALLGPRILQAETTADLMLTLLGCLMEGTMPALADVVFIQQALMRGVDLYQPMNLNQHINDANLDKDVARALMQQLGHNAGAGLLMSPSPTEDPSKTGQRPTGSFTMKHVPAYYQQYDYSTLAGALSVILSGGQQPLGWREATLASAAAGGGGGGDAGEGDNTGPLPRATADIGSYRSSSLGAALPFRGSVVPATREGTTTGAGIGVSVPCGGGFGFLQRNTSMEFSQVQHQPPPPLQQQQQQPDPRSPFTAVADRRSDASEHVPMRLVMGLVNAEIASAGVSSAMREQGDEAVGEGGPASGQSSDTLDDSALVASEPPRRRPPRKVASAVGANGLADSLRRRSLLQSSGVSVADQPGGNRPPDAASIAAAGSGRASCDWNSAAGAAAQAGTGTGTGSGPVQEVGTGGGLAQVGTRVLHALTGGSRASLAPQPSVRLSVLGKTQYLAPPPPPVIEEVERVLADADSWQFDMWRLRDATNGHPLSALGYYLIHRAGLITHLKLKPPVLARLLRHIEAGYNDNPYHNAVHAADVLQTLHVIIHGAQMHVNYLDHLGLLAAYFAAIVHDYGHPGLTNDFLVSTSDPLAVRYNDRSPLENHHAAAAFSLVQKPGLDLLAPLSKADRANFRKQVIEMVLGTDMKQHFALLSQFNTVHRLAGFAHGPAVDNPCKSASSVRASGAQQFLELREIVVNVSGQEVQAPKPLDETERLLSLQIAIKAADLGHLGEEFEVHQRWLSALEEEFFRQGDMERQLGLPISPLFDRSKQGVSKSQVGFFDFVALPLVFALSKAFPGAQSLMRCFWSNYNHWRTVDGMPRVEVPPLGPPTGATTG